MIINTTKSEPSTLLEMYSEEDWEKRKNEK
jgi:hypothetical protein